VEGEVVQLHLALLHLPRQLLVLPHRDVLAGEHEHHEHDDADDLHDVEPRTARRLQHDEHGRGGERDVGQQPGAHGVAGRRRVGDGHRDALAHQRPGRAEEAEREPPAPLRGRAGGVGAHGDAVGEDRVGDGHREHRAAEQPPAQQAVPGLGEGEDRDGQQRGVGHRIGDHGGGQRRCPGPARGRVEHRHPGHQAQRHPDQQRVQHAAGRGQTGAGRGEAGESHQRGDGEAQEADVGQRGVRGGDPEHVLVDGPRHLAGRPRAAGERERRPPPPEPAAAAAGGAQAAGPGGGSEQQTSDVRRHPARWSVQDGDEEAGAEQTGDEQHEHRDARRRGCRAGVSRGAHRPPSPACRALSESGPSASGSAGSPDSLIRVMRVARAVTGVGSAGGRWSRSTAPARCRARWRRPGPRARRARCW
jgi:hypothetical protein